MPDVFRSVNDSASRGLLCPPWRTSAPIAAARSVALPISCWVMRLVKSQNAPPLQAYCRWEAPSLVADGAARDPFLAETGNLCPQVVAHEIELMFAIALSGMAGEFRGRRGKDQPSTAGIDGGKAKHVPEKGPVGLGVACV